MAKIKLLAFSCLLSWVLVACELHPLNPFVGVSRSGDEINVEVVVCQSSTLRIWTVVTEGDSARPNDESIWEIVGSAPEGVFIVPIGSTPDGFSEVTPLEVTLPTEGDIAVYVEIDGADQVVGFLPEDIPARGVLSDGKILSDDEFQAAARERCGSS